LFNEKHCYERCFFYEIEREVCLYDRINAMRMSCNSYDGDDVYFKRCLEAERCILHCGTTD